ncbi:hypothetical protein B0H66DRAFT_575255 [Apodospora peruviana]|uniref:Uncharacterized protein n=1 Tax=Apodospora peruviana TaxID=516989 RepID=A0AAE0M3V7_9PEZI|nr:hypothetical protein B0H66DRAFT_575255 [Apodospora peruviana]
MDDFINWDNALPSMGVGQNSQLGLTVEGEHLTDLDLVLANVDGDDFSFWALEHYENSNMPAIDPTIVDTAMDMNSDEPFTPFEESFVIPDVPCTHCQTGGYQCKRICEGKYKGYCTSCVALRCGCSFGRSPVTLVPTDSAFPYNPWPVMGDHPDAITQEDMDLQKLNSASSDNVAGLASALDAEDTAASGAVATPKIGARLSRESVKILKNWLSTHHKHPYPNEEEKQMLQRQTGLNKTQITNWLANARRRRKIIAPRSTSPGVRSFSSSIDIPQRRGTPAAFEQMNPLQRWQISPPENEPASVTAIARAVTASTTTLSSGLNSPFSINFTDDGSGRSLCAVSSVSSINTSHSSGGSAFSHRSRGSFESLGSMNRGRRRRRRKAPGKGSSDKAILPGPPKAFQCTFCTETFRTKHDWQRHEKSLHLSLERWVCAPNGARAFNPENGHISCVFCGEANPDEAHIESHNHSACQERTLGERTFYRKDHLRQHLKLVHGVKFVNWSMEQWKVATPEIRSRCGFCNMVLDSWTIRVDHLAEHFKTGNTMADWKGDWGFDEPVLDMVENSIPPYLIHDERNSPYPYEATQGHVETARNAFELIKNELMFFASNHGEKKGRMPSDDELQLEACRIVFGSEVLSKKGMSSTPSWLRDLLVSSDELALQARLAPIRSPTDSSQAQLKINGKDNIFEEDPMERELHEFVKARSLLGLTAMDSELQVEACRIISRMEESSNHPCDDVANFLLRLIYSSPNWLAGFRQRAGLPRSEDVGDEATRSKDKSKIDSTIHNYSRLESELAEYVRNQRAMGNEPDDADLQKQARLIIYEFDDGWNQTAADNVVWLNAFKQRHLSSLSHSATSLTSPSAPLTLDPAGAGTSSLSCVGILGDSRSGSLNSGGGSSSSLGGLNSGGRSGRMGTKIDGVLYNDSNCYRRLTRELRRYVASTMSPNNPNCHIPSDQELQHQARWILYDDDDPWNQTACDNEEWLRRFKRDVGILTDPSLPGLLEDIQWNKNRGSIGLTPYNTIPDFSGALSSMISPLHTTSTSGNTSPASNTNSNNLLSASMSIPEDTTKCSPLQVFGRSNELVQPLVFCSHELESGLADYVTTEVALLGAEAFPTDEALRAQARLIEKMERTSADDVVLLGKFKEMLRVRLGLPQNQSQSQSPTPGQELVQELSAPTPAAAAAGGGGGGSRDLAEDAMLGNFEF